MEDRGSTPVLTPSGGGGGPLVGIQSVGGRIRVAADGVGGGAATTGPILSTHARGLHSSSPAEELVTRQVEVATAAAVHNGAEVRGGGDPIGLHGLVPDGHISEELGSQDTWSDAPESEPETEEEELHWLDAEVPRLSSRLPEYQELRPPAPLTLKRSMSSAGLSPRKF